MECGSVCIWGGVRECGCGWLSEVGTGSRWQGCEW